ncbi:hypothetical protein JB92DRAFT_3110684 [Gautieria morchelliformis]|nr:hypothetical protein JB92DRAFT_3110684 [Gautieria morchelliformis]
MQLPRIQELHLQDDYRHLILPPLKARPRMATPPLPIPDTLPARSRRQRGARKTKAIKIREAQGRTARGCSSPRTRSSTAGIHRELRGSRSLRRTTASRAQDSSGRAPSEDEEPTAGAVGNDIDGR